MVSAMPTLDYLTKIWNPHLAATSEKHYNDPVF